MEKLLESVESTQPFRIFCCGSSETKDKVLCEHLVVQLTSLKRKHHGLIIWSNNDVLAGLAVKEEIERQLRLADIILLLISPEFMADDYFYFTIIEQARKRRAEANVDVLPIILRSTSWKDSSLKGLQVLPKSGEPITSWSNQDEAFFDVISGIDEVIIRKHGPLDSPFTPTSDTPLTSNKREEKFVNPELLLPTRELWANGNEIIIDKVRYNVYHIEEPVWAKDGSALRQQAKARRLDTNQMVWLKQVRTFRPGASDANTWGDALEKEARLLNELEQEQERFPRRLNMWSTSYEKTLIYVAFSGRSLADVFGNGEKPIDPPLIRRFLQSIPSLCFMLQALHKKGLAHRMLTPATILLVKGRNATVQDIGLAAMTPRPGEGPDLYRAPEQIRLRPQSVVKRGAADVYQLGAILYHMLTGHLPQTPFPGEKIITPSEWSPAISEQLDELLLQTIRPNPTERCSIGTFGRRLKEISH